MKCFLGQPDAIGIGSVFRAERTNVHKGRSNKNVKQIILMRLISHNPVLLIRTMPDGW